MSLDASLKSASSLSRHRNVLTRAERMEKLQSAGKWSDDRSVLGLPKVAHRKMAIAGKVKEEGDAADAAATPAAAGKAPAGKAAPAAAAKAPAAKAAPAAKKK